MLRSLEELIGYKIQAKDGRIGDVHDFYFDDADWTVRYLVVDTGKWLPGKLVLLSPVSIGESGPDWSKHELPVALDKRQIEEAPSAATNSPVSRQMEAELSKHYGWPVYWPATPEVAVSAAPHPGSATSRQAVTDERPKGDPHLRSALEVTGYHIGAADGEIGHVEDFIADTVSWVIRYMVVDTRNWLPGRKVLVAPDWIESVKWEDRRVYTELSRAEIQDSPKFDPHEPVNRAYEVRIYDYYGRPSYWNGDGIR